MTNKADSETGPTVADAIAAGNEYASVAGATAPVVDKGRTVLVGHTSEETAYLVADYPYGFRLRCRIRYWLETTKHGTRFCSQTTNPKRGGIWNKPKKGTYHSLAVMVLDEQGHVSYTVVSRFASGEERILAFAADHAAALTSERDQKEIAFCLACARASKHVTVTVREVKPGEAYQSREEQAKIWGAAIGHELRVAAKSEAK